MATHDCPYPGCTVQVAYDRFACGPHWFTLSRPLRYAISRAWRSGKVDEHAAAMDAAIQFYEFHAAAHSTGQAPQGPIDLGDDPDGDLDGADYPPFPANYRPGEAP